MKFIQISELDQVALEMYKNIHLSGLLKLESVHEEGQSHILTFQTDGLISLHDLIKNRQITKKLLLNTLESLIQLEQYLDNYLLSPECLSYCPDTIYYHAETLKALWGYLPLSTPNDNWKYKRSSLFSQLINESADLKTTEDLKPFLAVQTFESKQLYQQLTVSVNIEKKKFQLKTLFANKPKSDSQPITHDPQLRSNLKTVYAKRTPMLLSRENATEQHKIYYDNALLGRSENCDIIINHESVSREHARLTRVEQHYYLEDLSSTNGVRLNQCALIGKTEIKNGDSIRIGDCDYLFIL